MKRFVVVLMLPTNVVDRVCSVNVVLAVNAPKVKIPEAKAAKAARAKKVKVVTNNHVNDANFVHAVKVAGPYVVLAIVRVVHVAMKMVKLSTVMVAMVPAQPAKVPVKVKVAKMDVQNATSDAISVDHHVDHVAADHHAIAKEMMVMAKVAMLAKMAKKDHEELDVIIETAHQNKAAPIK